ncbi:MAG: Hsp20 family protein [Oligoflexales bacterium]|nr:Hsp20 family protein [Oligoflexales bacterium]
MNSYNYINDGVYVDFPFEGIFSDPLSVAAEFKPSWLIKEHKGYVTININLPEVETGDINIESRNHTLLISINNAQSRKSGESNDRTFKLSKPIQREFQLAKHLDAERFQTSYEDDILEIRIPIIQIQDSTMI